MGSLDLLVFFAALIKQRPRKAVGQNPRHRFLGARPGQPAVWTSISMGFWVLRLGYLRGFDPSNEEIVEA